MLNAVARLTARGVLSLPEAWQLVSGNPAAAMGLTDRGRIAPGCRADLIALAPDRREDYAARYIEDYTLRGTKLDEITLRQGTRLLIRIN